MKVEALSPALPHLLAWADADPEVRMQSSSIEAFRAGFEAAGKSAEPLPVAPAIVLEPSLRQSLVRWYGEIADTWRDLHRPAEEARVRRRITTLEREGDLSLAELLERIAP